MANDSNIYRKHTCDICGNFEYRPYLGTDHLDGGFTAIDKFEPTEFRSVRVGDSSWMACPDCQRSVEATIIDMIKNHHRWD